MSKAKHWNERFALIDKYKPTDEQITAAFGINMAELSTARQLLKAGTISVKQDIDFTGYSNPFENIAAETQTVTSTVLSKKTAKPSTVSSISTSTQVAETATKRKQSSTTSSLSSGRRGRKGDKILKAFQAIPVTPISATAFAKQHNISLPVLRQSKRFDKSGELGNVRVKMNKDSRVLEIWREKV